VFVPPPPLENEVAIMLGPALVMLPSALSRDTDEEDSGFKSLWAWV
jgi:hypothetical protein